MAVWTLGINHHTAPLDMRGRFAFTLDQMAPLLQGLRQHLSLKNEIQPPEVAIVSTCNRTEVYCAHQLAQSENTLHWLAQTAKMNSHDLSQFTYTLNNEQAARHAFRVASGLDSMVLGEAQILGQLKDAVKAAEAAGALGSTLNHLFQKTFSVAKEVRTATEIGAHSISMAAASVRLASNLFEDLSQIKVLFIGAGEMIDLVATHFAAKTPKSMTIANRSIERGDKLAARFSAQSIRLASIHDQLHEYDAIISCTASSVPIIGLGAVETAIKKRKHRPILMVDLAVPRDIEAEVKDLSDVYLYTVDDLAKVVEQGQSQRQAAVLDAEIIIDAGVQQFTHWLNQRQLVPLIHQLQEQALDWQQQEIAKTKKLIAKGVDIDQALEALARGLSQKMLHGSFAELRNGDLQAQSSTAQSIQRLFLRKER